MAITALNDYAIGDVNFNTMMTTLDKTFKGKADITLSNYDTTAAPVVKVGSVFENNGSLFIVDTSDTTPTGYAGISNSTTFYLVYDESAGAFIYSSSAPTWNDALQGWYVGNDRYFFSMYKDSGGTLYEDKAFLSQDGKTRISELQVNDITYNKRPITSNNYYHATATNGVIFTALDSIVPNVGDKIKISGGGFRTISSTNNRIFSFSRLERVSPTQINAYGAELFLIPTSVVGGGIATVSFSSGGSTTYSLSISW